MKTTIVTTTIHVPELLRGVAENAKFYGHQQVDMIVIGDRKTPPDVAEFCASISERYYRCEFLDVAAQLEYLSRFPDLREHLPFNSIERRNIGMLRAYEQRADVIITVDDDNFVSNQDFIGCHAAAGSVRRLPAYASTSGWFNICSGMEADCEFYPRGYPFSKRWTERDAFVTTCELERRVVVNGGLWLDDPDVDAITRMARPVVATGIKPGWPPSFALQPGTWAPFNSQNTSLARDVVPAYFLSPYMQRYDDIWAGYIVVRIAERFGDLIVFGEPLVRQKRNPHDLWRDLDHERTGMILTDEFCDALKALPLTAQTYHGCFGEIASQLGDAWPEKAGWTPAMREARVRLLEGLKIWHSVFDALTPASEPRGSAASTKR